MSQIVASASRATLALQCGALQFAKRFTKAICLEVPHATSGSTFLGKLQFKSIHGLVTATTMEKYRRSDKSQTDVSSIPWLGIPSPTIEESCKMLERFNTQGVPPPCSDLPLPWIGGMLDCHGDSMTSSPTDYEVDLGKIIDTLQTDYSAFFRKGAQF